MFCPECGSSEGEIIEGVCKECFLKNFSILKIPTNLEVTICGHCNAKLEEGKWKDSQIVEEEIIYRALEKAIEIDPLVEQEEIELEILQMRGSIAECYIEAVAIVLGKKVYGSWEVEVRLNKSVCPDCSKMNSGYYESVIQLRADKRELDNNDILKADNIIEKSLISLSKKNKLAYLVQKATMKEGVDYYIGSYKAAKKIVNDLKNKFGGIIKESPRLISQDKSTGKGIYRIWISLRLPIFKKGDFIQYSDKIGQVIDIYGNKIIAIDLNSYDKFSISWKDYNQIKILKKKKDSGRTNIISKSPDKIQILDPDNYEVLDLDMNDKFFTYEIGDEINIIKINEITYIIPE